MAQHDYNIGSSDSKTGLQVRQDINNALIAIKSSNSGPVAPSSPVVGMVWHNVTNNISYKYTGTAWVAIADEVSVNSILANISQEFLNAAAASASAAAISASAAEAIFDSFDDRYLGAKAIAPTLDNDGNPLVSGAIYFNSSTSQMYVYDTITLTWISTSFNPADHNSLTNIGTLSHTQLETSLVGKQPIDATLTALSGVVTVADKLIYAIASDTFTTTTLTAFGRSVIDDIDAIAGRITLDISATNTPSIAVGGISATNVQSALQELDTEKVAVNTAIIASTATKITYDTKGLVTSGTTLSASDIPSLDANKITTGTIDPARLPSYVDDVLEVATKALLPVTGEVGKIYVVVADESAGGDTSSYRWTGSVYAIVSNTLAGTDIKSLYTGQPNTFQDTDKTKLNNITITQAVNLDTVETNSDASKVVTDKMVVTAVTSVTFNADGSITIVTP